MESIVGRSGPVKGREWKPIHMYLENIYRLFICKVRNISQWVERFGGEKIKNKMYVEKYLKSAMIGQKLRQKLLIKHKLFWYDTKFVDRIDLVFGTIPKNMTWYVERRRYTFEIYMKNLPTARRHGRRAESRNLAVSRAGSRKRSSIMGKQTPPFLYLLPFALFHTWFSPLPSCCSAEASLLWGINSGGTGILSTQSSQCYQEP